MDIDRFKNIVKAVRSAYPQFKFIESKEGMQIWLKALEDTPDEAVSLAFEKHMMTSKYPPSIADIREKIFELSGEIKGDWSLAFDLTRRAISKFGSYREEEALAWIEEQDSLAAEVTRRLGFKEICLSENLEVVRGQYRMAYENYSADKKSYGMLPTATKMKQREIERSYELQGLEDNSHRLDDVLKLMNDEMSME